MRALRFVAIAWLVCRFGGSILASESQDNSPVNPVRHPYQRATSDFSGAFRSFPGHGVIQELPSGGGTVVIRHEEIPGYMPKMTMEFTVQNTNDLRGLQTGDEIDFVLKVSRQESRIEELHRTRAGALPAATGQSLTELAQVAKLKPGDPMPDGELLAENGQKVHLSDFHGKALAFTFIFTRCPVPEFCPRMSQRFNQARELLLHMAGGPTNWQFLSISFDAQFDTPAVLAGYADYYREQSPDRWLFAAAPTNVLAEMASQLDFRFTNDSGCLVHNLRTAVLDPQGRLYRLFIGNEWDAGELAQAMAEAARLPAAGLRAQRSGVSGN
jgi:protein SCO1/2